MQMSSHHNVTCSHHDIAEKLLTWCKTALTNLLTTYLEQHLI